MGMAIISRTRPMQKANKPIMNFTKQLLPSKHLSFIVIAQKTGTEKTSTKGNASKRRRKIPILNRIIFSIFPSPYANC